MIDYIRLIGDCYPDLQVECRDDTWVYENLIAVVGTLPTQYELDTVYRNQQIELIIERLSLECRNKIISGFQSNALGAAHWYDSGEEDQLNLIGQLSRSQPRIGLESGKPVPFAACKILQETPFMLADKDYYIHTYDQMQQLVDDGEAFKIHWLMRFNQLRLYLRNADVDLDTLQALTMDTVL